MGPFNSLKVNRVQSKALIMIQDTLKSSNKSKMILLIEIRASVVN